MNITGVSWVTSSEAGASHTNWALIFDATKGDSVSAEAALDQLVRRYWPAVYAYIRQSGRSVDEASDLTQGFVCDAMVSRKLLKVADPKRGRFRTLLLTAIKNYLAENHRHSTRMKRSPSNKPLQLDETALDGAELKPGLTPEQAFVAQWNATMIRRVLEQVQRECNNEGLDTHWAVFEARVVRPMFFGGKQLPYPALIERLQLRDSGQAANMMVTVKRRFVRALIEEVGLTVNDPMGIEAEIHGMLRELEKQR